MKEDKNMANWLKMFLPPKYPDNNYNKCSSKSRGKTKKKSKTVQIKTKIGKKLEVLVIRTVSITKPLVQCVQIAKQID